MNLPRYKFYIKISAIESEEPFSGTTLYSPVVKDVNKIEQLIEASRKNWAIEYKKNTVSEVITRVIEDVSPKAPIKSEQTKKRNGFPESKTI